MFISITRLRLRNWLYLPMFFIASGKCVKQAQISSGFVKGATLSDRKLAFWTVTLWNDTASMKEYRSSGAHKEIMPKFAGWCSEGCVGHWETSDHALPDWPEIGKQMRVLGRPSPVDHPSSNHPSMAFLEPTSEPWRNRPFASLAR